MTNRHRLSLILALLAPVLCGCPASPEPKAARAPIDSAAGEIDFRYTGPSETAIVVPVHINGTGPYNFVIDTGATMTCVDEQLRQRLGLPDRPGTLNIGAGLGGTGRFRVAQIDTFRVGHAVAIRLPACVLDLSQFRRLGVDTHGLVGLNFLKQFRVALDFERDVLRLQQ